MGLDPSAPLSLFCGDVSDGCVFEGGGGWAGIAEVHRWGIQGGATIMIANDCFIQLGK
jgi:hypothetical protein